MARRKHRGRRRGRKQHNIRVEEELGIPWGVDVAAERRHPHGSFSNMAKKVNTIVPDVFKNDYSNQPPPMQSHVVEGPHGYSPIPPMDQEPADPAGLNPLRIRVKK